MALHRDIYWVGRQWAVTGFGLQAIDQRLKGAFDVEAGKIWDDDLPRRMRALAWLNADDFAKALELARTRFPEPPRKKGLPLVESVLELIQPAGTEPPPQPSSAPIATTVRDKDLAREDSAGKDLAKKDLARTDSAKTALTKNDLGKTDLAKPRDLAETAPPPAVALTMELPRVLPQSTSQPLAMQIKHVSAKFLPRWRIRHGAP